MPPTGSGWCLPHGGYVSLPVPVFLHRRTQTLARHHALINARQQAQVQAQLQLPAQIQTQINLQALIHSRVYAQIESQIQSQLYHQFFAHLYPQFYAQLYPRIYAHLQHQIHAQIQHQLHALSNSTSTLPQTPHPQQVQSHNIMVPISILSLLGLSNLASALFNNNNNTSTASQPINNLNVSTNAVGAAVIPPPNGVQTGGGWDPNKLASEAELDKLQDKGRWMSCLLDGSDEDAGKAWPDPYSRTPPSARSRWTGAICKMRLLCN
jgi:Ni,Fe-hydrogenase I large subunit